MSSEVSLNESLVNIQEIACILVSKIFEFKISDEKMFLYIYGFYHENVKIVNFKDFLLLVYNHLTISLNGSSRAGNFVWFFFSIIFRLEIYNHAKFQMLCILSRMLVEYTESESFIEIFGPVYNIHQRKGIIVHVFSSEDNFIKLNLSFFKSEKTKQMQKTSIRPFDEKSSYYLNNIWINHYYLVIPEKKSEMKCCENLKNIDNVRYVNIKNEHMIEKCFEILSDCYKHYKLVKHNKLGN